MQTVKKKILLFSGLLALFGLLILSKKTTHTCSKHLVESPEKSMHEKLLDSKRSLEKAASVIQSILDEMDSDVHEYTDGSND